MKYKVHLLTQKQSLPLALKEGITEDVIREWYAHWDGEVYVAFSGGKDSTVLLHQVRRIYPDTKAVFFDTGLEFPEIRNFVKTFENVVWLKPKMNFKAVIEKYGYPVVSKQNAQRIDQYRNTKSEKLRLIYLSRDSQYRIPLKWRFLINAPFKISDRCCNVMKKRPAKKFTQETGLQPMIGTMAQDSKQRERTYLSKGCNSFDGKNPRSNPLSVWTEKDIWEYIKKYNIPTSPIYQMGYCRTGCAFCMFGLHMEKHPNRFELMKQTHPQLYRYCMEELGMYDVLDYIRRELLKRKLGIDNPLHP